MYWFISGHSFFYLTHDYLLSPVPHYLYCRGFKVSWASEKSPSNFFFFKIILAVLIPLYFHRNVTISLLTENKTNKTTKTWNPAGISFGLCQLCRYTKRELTDNHSLFRVSIFSVLGGLGFQGHTYFIYLSIFFKDLFLILCIWMCVPVYMTAGLHRGQKKVWGLLELELLVSVSCSAWVLGTENNSICF